MPEFITKLEMVARLAEQRRDQNFKFRTFVKHKLKLSDAEVDRMVHETTARLSARMDCTACGNCCRTLQVAVDNDDAARLAKRLRMSFREFERRYVRRAATGEKHIASPPCPFLRENRCTVYEDRPKACRDFPYLHEPDFRQRMLTAIDNTAVCPIVFNAFEELKVTTGFRDAKGGKKPTG